LILSAFKNRIRVGLSLTHHAVEQSKNVMVREYRYVDLPKSQSLSSEWRWW